MQKNINLQDVFLNQARKEKLPLTMFLMNGFQLRGIVNRFRQFYGCAGYGGQAAAHL
jgi:host factor-I protein